MTPNKVFTITRIKETDNETWGMMCDESTPFCLTLERKWLYNKHDESCIPEGEYICNKILSPEFGNTYEVTNVPNRDHILIHKGNIYRDTHGCIIVGSSLGSIGGILALLDSGSAFNEFIRRVDGLENFKLVIERK